ncbi:MAG: hypothetical protein WCI61_11455, partial [Chloroflexota bacterium]
MRLGIDFDNTLGDFVSLLREITLARTGFDIRNMRERYPDAEHPETIIHAAVGKERFESFLTEIHETDLTLRMPPQPGAVEVARRLAERHELIVLTARGTHESEAVHRWLERHAIPVRGYIATNRAPKAPHAIEHDLVTHLDDSAEVTLPQPVPGKISIEDDGLQQLVVAHLRWLDLGTLSRRQSHPRIPARAAARGGPQQWFKWFKWPSGARRCPRLGLLV